MMSSRDIVDTKTARFALVQSTDIARTDPGVCRAAEIVGTVTGDTYM